MGRTADSTSSTDSTPPRDPESGGDAASLLVGRIVGAHGLRGQLRLRYFANDPEDLLELPEVRLVGGDGEAVAYAVVRATPGRAGELRLGLEGVRTRDAAEALRGCEVRANPAHLRGPEDGEYYAHQLVGCRVEDDDGLAIGTVKSIWSTGSADVLVLEDAEGRELLIPAAAPVVREVDVVGQRIVVDLIPGLLDPTESA